MSQKQLFINKVMRDLYGAAQKHISDVEISTYIANGAIPFIDKGRSYCGQYSSVPPTMLSPDEVSTFRNNMKPYQEVIREMKVIESFLIRWANSNSGDLRSLEEGIPKALRITDADKYCPCKESKIIEKRLMLNSLGKTI
jgi:hypothetical protein